MSVNPENVVETATGILEREELDNSEDSEDLYDSKDSDSDVERGSGSNDPASDDESKRWFPTKPILRL